MMDPCIIPMTSRGDAPELCPKYLKKVAAAVDAKGICLPSCSTDAEKTTLDRQSATIAVIDKAKLPEFVHEVTDPRSCCAHHLRQVILADSRQHGFRPALFAKMGKQQKNPGKTLFAGVEKLIHKIGFIPDVAGKQVRDKHFRDLMPLMEQTGHQLAINPVKRAICHCRSRFHAQHLPCQASFAKKLARIQKRDDRFLALSGRNRELHPSPIEKEQESAGCPCLKISRVAPYSMVVLPREIPSRKAFTTT